MRILIFLSKIWAKGAHYTQHNNVLLPHPVFQDQIVGVPFVTPFKMQNLRRCSEGSVERGNGQRPGTGPPASGLGIPFPGLPSAHGFL